MVKILFENEMRICENIKEKIKENEDYSRPRKHQREVWLDGYCRDKRRKRMRGKDE